MVAANAGTFAFSLNWVFHRSAATAAIPSAPQTTGTRPPIASASRFDGFVAAGAPAPPPPERGGEPLRRVRRGGNAGPLQADHALQLEHRLIDIRGERGQDAH